VKKQLFDREKHVYKCDEFLELVLNAIRFFNGTPVHGLPLVDKFNGTGIYAIYYTGKIKPYEKYGVLNRSEYNHPIYVGKAVPKGWRKSRISDNTQKQGTELCSRLRQHTCNIKACGFDLKDFAVRFVIFENDSSDMISAVEAALIKLKLPLWNVVIDGFGNHTPGKGRFEQAKSDWDVIHPGRDWANKCNGQHNEASAILDRIKYYFSKTKAIEGN